MAAWDESWTVESDSSPGKKYTVSVSRDGVWGCTCPHWIHQKGSPEDRTPCKHIRHMRGKLHVDEIERTYGKTTQIPGRVTGRRHDQTSNRFRKIEI